MNLLYELRSRLQLSRAQFGKLVDKSEATIEKYEAEISREFATQLSKLARKRGHPDLAMLLDVAAGQQEQNPPLEPTALAPDEIEFLKACLSIYRQPTSEYEKSVITIVRELIKIRRKHK